MRESPNWAKPLSVRIRVRSSSLICNSLSATILVQQVTFACSALHYIGELGQRTDYDIRASRPQLFLGEEALREADCLSTCCLRPHHVHRLISNRRAIGRSQPELFDCFDEGFGGRLELGQLFRGHYGPEIVGEPPLFETTHQPGLPHEGD